MKIEVAALFLEPSVLIILSFLKPKEATEITVREWNENEKEYIKK